MLTINNTRNNPNFTSTFTLRNTPLQSPEIVDFALEELVNKIIKVPSEVFKNSNPSAIENAFYTKFKQGPFNLIRHIFSFTIEHPQHDERIYNKVTIFVPDEKDSLVKHILKESELYGYDTSKFKTYKHVRIHSNINGSKTQEHFLLNILNKAFDNIPEYSRFKILKAIAFKKSPMPYWIGEAELRIPEPWLQKVEQSLNKNRIIYKVTDKPRFLNYA